MRGSASSGSRNRNLCNYCKRLEFKAETDEESEALAAIYFAWATGKISVQRIAALVSEAQAEARRAPSPDHVADASKMVPSPAVKALVEAASTYLAESSDYFSGDVYKEQLLTVLAAVEREIGGA